MTPEVATERPVAMMESGPGRRHHRVGAGRRSARISQRHLLRHGRHHRQGEPHPRRRADHGAGLLRRRLCQRPSGDAADDRRGRGRRRRRLDRVDRRHRRAEGRAAERGRRSGTDLLSRRRHRADHHRRQCGARPARSGQFPRRQDEARRRRRAHAASRTRSPSRSSMDAVAAAQAISTSRSPRCRSRCAKSRSRRATIRATSRWSLPAAPARCTSCAIARELHIPTVIVPLFPVAFLRARHAARRRAPRLHAHLLFRPRQRRLRALVDDPRRDGRRTRKAACATRKDAERQIHLDLRYVGQEFTLQVPVTLEQLKSGDRQAIRTAFDALYEHRYAHHSPDEPVEMVNIRLGAIGKRADARTSRASAPAARPAPRGERAGLFHARRSKPLTARSIERDDARRRRARSPGPALDPGARHDHGAVRGRHVHGGADPAN